MERGVTTGERTEAEPLLVSAGPQDRAPTERILQIADDVLAAKIAMAEHDNVAAIAHLKNAVAVQDTLKYGEPPDWYFPVRESLGAALMVKVKSVPFGSGVIAADGLVTPVLNPMVSGLAQKPLV